MTQKWSPSQDRRPFVQHGIASGHRDTVSNSGSPAPNYVYQHNAAPESRQFGKLIRLVLINSIGLARASGGARANVRRLLLRAMDCCEPKATRFRIRDVAAGHGRYVTQQGVGAKLVEGEAAWLAADYQGQHRAMCRPTVPAPDPRDKNCTQRRALRRGDMRSSTP